MIKLIFDTNTIISALINSTSKPATSLKYAIHNCKILISTQTIYELQDVLARKKFDKYISVLKRKEFINEYLFVAKFVEINSAINICRDHKDNKFLELVHSGNADYLITGDDDLLSINKFECTHIIQSSKFIEIIV
jgi:putative PIN family toxin of toxin-antitoxin system